jgi:AcrR family transcriptional regulator
MVGAREADPAPREMAAELAEAAFDLFSERGVQNVHLDEVAARAGVTKGSLYWHYESKKDLLVAACLHYYRTWQRRIHAEVSRSADPLERLELAIRFSVRSCLLDERNRVFSTEIFAMSLHDPDLRRGWAQFYDTVREFYVGLFEAARAAGRLETPDPRGAVNLMLHCFEGIKQRASFEPEILSQSEAIGRQLLGVLLGSDRGRGKRRE